MLTTRNLAAWERVDLWKRQHRRVQGDDAREWIILPVEGPLLHIAAAAWLAVVAYPEKIKRRDHFIGAFRAWAWRGSKHDTPERWRWRPRDINRTFDAACKRIVTRRIPAAEGAMLVILNESTKDGSIRVRTEAKNITAAVNLAPHFGARVKGYRNLRSKVWAETKPVLAVTLGLRSVILDRKGFDLIDLMMRPDWLPNAIDSADRFATRDLPQYLGITPGESIRFSAA